MGIKYKFLFPVICSVSLLSCATQEMVSEKSVEYLNKKYNGRFRVVSVNMNHDEGNWGTADIIASPESDSTLTFSVVYDYSDEKLVREYYKDAIWNRGAGGDAEKLIQNGKFEVKIKARITDKGSITLNSMDLPYKTDYNEIIPLLEKPAVSFNVDLFSQDECSDRIWPFENLISATETFRGKGFRKVMMSVNLFCGGKRDRAYQTLSFKLTKEQPAPGINTIKKLVHKKDEPPFSKEVSSIYAEARKLQESGNAEGALNLYMRIVRNYDNPYRYDPYAPSESGCVIESAFYAAGIERAMGNIQLSKKLYALVAGRIDYFEVKAEFIEMEKEAKKFLDSK